MASLQEVFAERRLKCEQEQARLEAEEKAEHAKEKAIIKAKNDAKKQALLKHPNSPKAIQAKYAEECKQLLQEDKRYREAILRRAEGDRIARKEKDEREMQIRHRRALAQANNVAMAADTYINEGARRMRSPERDMIGSSENYHDIRYPGESDDEEEPYTATQKIQNAYESGQSNGRQRLELCSNNAVDSAHSGQEKKPQSMDREPKQPKSEVTSSSAPKHAAAEGHQDLHHRIFSDRSNYSDTDGDFSKKLKTPIKAEDTGIVADKSDTSHELPELPAIHMPTETTFNVAYVPNKILRDYALIRSCFEASDQEIWRYLKARYAGQSSLKGVKVANIAELESEARKRGLLNAALDEQL